MKQELKPTNEAIKQYLLEWLTWLDGRGLIITDDEELRDSIHRTGVNTDFNMLRTMFAPVIYDNIEEWKEDNQ